MYKLSTTLCSFFFYHRRSVDVIVNITGSVYLVMLFNGTHSLLNFVQLENTVEGACALCVANGRRKETFGTKGS